MYKEYGAQILRRRKNILYTILHVTSFLLSELRDVRTQKSRLK